jgi:hypothetical protein
MPRLAKDDVRVGMRIEGGEIPVAWTKDVVPVRRDPIKYGDDLAEIRRRIDAAAKKVE